MTIRPDPTFHATAKLAMEAPAEKYAYCLMLSPDFSQWLVRLFVGAVAAVWSRVP
jgi:hypothetical protein